jgi:PAS domain S-box-containing protein
MRTESSDTDKPVIYETSGKSFRVMDILDSLPFYVLLVDADHHIIDANQATYKQLGVKREEIIGQYCPAVIHDMDHPFSGCPLEEAVEKNRAVERELFDEKTKRWFVSSMYPTRAFTEQGKRVYLHVVFDVTDRRLAQEQLKASHEQLRRLSAHLESVREEEKNKIARDLHDSTSQVLASLHMYLEAAIETLPAGSDKSKELLRKAQTLSTTILDDIHRLIYELRPFVIDELGLEAAIHSMLENYLKFTSLKVHFTTSGQTTRLSPQLEIMLFRVIQEAFNNIVKHANARNAYLKLQYKKKSIKISIRDDGIGFNVQETRRPKIPIQGLGLISMKERIELVNGSLVINSSPGSGTKIIIEVPAFNGEVDG